MITTHYQDQYPFGCEDVGQRRRVGPALICTLAPHHHYHHPISGRKGGLPEHRRGWAVAGISLHGNKWKGWQLWADGVQGLGQGTGEGRGTGEEQGAVNPKGAMCSEKHE